MQSVMARIDASDLRSRLPGSQIAKTVVAAVVAYAVAGALTKGGDTLLAPLTALLVTQVTVFETLTSGLRRVVAVVSGVLIAVALAQFVYLGWWSLGLLLAAAFSVGSMLRLGDHSTEVAISAMLVFAVGGAHSTASSRIVETLIGAAVGVVFNLIVAPVRVEPAGAAVRTVADRTAQVLDRAADDLAADWSHDRARQLLQEARRLRAEVGRAEDAFADAERSLRLNPRAGRLRAVTPSLRAALAAVEHVAVAVRSLARTLAERSDGDPTNAKTLGPHDVGRRQLSAVARELASATRAFGWLAGGDINGPSGGEEDLRAALDRARAARQSVGDALAVDPRSEPRLWKLHGALLSDIDRILRELDPQAGPDASQVLRAAPPRRRWMPQQRPARTRTAVRRIAHAAKATGKATWRFADAGDATAIERQAYAARRRARTSRTVDPKRIGRIGRGR
jgi:uncharacterized membrane protein YgaE (UPF0421/DUF939 family)